jgi:hypothetical protein
MGERRIRQARHISLRPHAGYFGVSSKSAPEIETRWRMIQSWEFRRFINFFASSLAERSAWLRRFLTLFPVDPNRESDRRIRKSNPDLLPIKDFFC